jgi:hypothetical protein
MNIVDSTHWPIFSRFIASPAAPEDYNEAAIERLMEEINDYIVDVKNVRPQFNAINRVMMIDFDNPEAKAKYDKAYENYCIAVGKLEGHKNSSFAKLVEWLKFRQEAELCRAPFLARSMWNGVKEGYATVCACNFKATIAKITHVLNSNYKVPRQQISLIWGGSQLYSQAKEEKFTKEDVHQNLADILAGKNVDVKVLKKMRLQLLADLAGIGDLDMSLNLGPQDFEQRQEEIDRFQRGDSLYCLFNFKSGGVGLSLHHSDELTTAKVRRRKESNYAYEEDIPLVSTRPRLSFLAPTYSAIELVQGLGRAPRLTSLSDTLQTLVFYKGTIEVAVAAIVSAKLKCLKKVVRQRETWEDMIIGQHARLNDTVDESNIDGSELFEVDNTDEDEDE